MGDLMSWISTLWRGKPSSCSFEIKRIGERQDVSPPWIQKTWSKAWATNAELGGLTPNRSPDAGEPDLESII